MSDYKLKDDFRNQIMEYFKDKSKEDLLRFMLFCANKVRRLHQNIHKPYSHTNAIATRALDVLDKYLQGEASKKELHDINRQLHYVVRYSTNRSISVAHSATMLHRYQPIPTDAVSIVWETLDAVKHTKRMKVIDVERKIKEYLKE